MFLSLLILWPFRPAYIICHIDEGYILIDTDFPHKLTGLWVSTVDVFCIGTMLPTATAEKSFLWQTVLWCHSTEWESALVLAWVPLQLPLPRLCCSYHMNRGLQPSKRVLWNILALVSSFVLTSFWLEYWCMLSSFLSKGEGIIDGSGRKTREAISW